jgi:hypothetical protein
MRSGTRTPVLSVPSHTIESAPAEPGAEVDAAHERPVRAGAHDADPQARRGVGQGPQDRGRLAHAVAVGENALGTACTPITTAPAGPDEAVARNASARRAIRKERGMEPKPSMGRSLSQAMRARPAGKSKGLSRREEAPEHLAEAIPRAVSIHRHPKARSRAIFDVGAEVYSVLEMRTHRSRATSRMPRECWVRARKNRPREEPCKTMKGTPKDPPAPCVARMEVV